MCVLCLHICIYYIYMGVSKNSGTPKWMVKIRENHIKMDDFRGFTTIFGSTPIYTYTWGFYRAMFVDWQRILFGETRSSDPKNQLNR